MHASAKGFYFILVTTRDGEVGRPESFGRLRTPRRIGIKISIRDLHTCVPTIFYKSLTRSIRPALHHGMFVRWRRIVSINLILGWLNHLFISISSLNLILIELGELYKKSRGFPRLSPLTVSRWDYPTLTSLSGTTSVSLRKLCNTRASFTVMLS